MREIALGGLLIVNGLLLVAVALRPTAGRAFIHNIFGTSPSSATFINATDSGARSRPSDITGGAWATVDFSDFRNLHIRLQAEGFPMFVVRAVVSAAVNEHFLTRQRSILPKRTIPSEYWRNPPIMLPASLEVREAMRDLDREKNRILQELLGSDFRIRDDDDEATALRRRRYGDLSIAKISQIERINADYADLTARVHEDSLGIMRPADYERLAVLEREKRSDLERLLNPVELLDYQLRNDPSASAVRNRLGQFSASEEEFRALYMARKAVDDIIASMSGNVTSEIAQQRSNAERQWEEQFRSILGEQRQLEYLRANRPDLTRDLGQFGASPNTIGRIVERLDLPATTTHAVIELQGQFYDRVNTILGNKQIKPEERQTQVLKLGMEAMESFTAALGGLGFEAYRRNGGRWIDDLLRPTN